MLGFVAGLILFAFLGGCAGVFYQTGFWDMVQKSASTSGPARLRYSKKVTKPVTQEEYKRCTRLGWYIGAGVGAGGYLVLFLKLKKEAKGDE